MGCRQPRPDWVIGSLRARVLTTPTCSPIGGRVPFSRIPQHFEQTPSPASQVMTLRTWMGLSPNFPSMSLVMISPGAYLPTPWARTEPMLSGSSGSAGYPREVPQSGAVTTTRWPMLLNCLPR